ncbi:hypothetical protein BHM03_00061523, partial [Ensete ventricosum]
FGPCVLVSPCSSFSAPLARSGRNGLFPFVYHLWFLFRPSSLVPLPRVEEHRPSSFSGDQSGPLSSSLGVMTWVDVKALQALDVVKLCHDFDSTMSLESLVLIPKRYSISDEYILQSPGPGQCSYHPCPKGFNISIDALDAGLRFPLYPIIGECLDWWRIIA